MKGQGQVSVLCREVREAFSHEVVFEQRSEESVGVSYVSESLSWSV